MCAAKGQFKYSHFVPSPELVVLQKRVVDLEWAIFDGEGHMGGFCARARLGMPLSEDGVLPTECPWCGCGQVGRRDHVQGLRRELGKAKRAMTNLTTREVREWWHGMQPPLFPEAPFQSGRS